MERPKLARELAAERYAQGDKTAFDGLPRPSHCDSRILHHVDDGCDFCRDAVALQEERERLGVSNTGHANRKFPCPADQARSAKDYHRWPGNQPKTMKQMDEEAAAFAEELEKHGLVVKK
jgi:hypothetical protein